MMPTKNPKTDKKIIGKFKNLMTNQNLVVLREAIRCGVKMADAAVLIGSYPAQLTWWIDKGKNDFAEGKATPAAELYVLVEKARTERAMESLARISKAAAASEVKEIERIKDKDGNIVRTKERITQRSQWEADVWLLENVDGYKFDEAATMNQNTTAVFVELKPAKAEQPKEE